MEKMEVRVRIVRRYRSSFERQIGESIWLNSYIKEGVSVLNSKNEYNRCTIPRLGMALKEYDDEIDEYNEKQVEKKMRQELHKLKEKLRYGTAHQKSKKQRLNNGENDLENMPTIKATSKENIKRIIKRKRLKENLELSDKKKLDNKVKMWRELTVNLDNEAKNELFDKIQLKVPIRTIKTTKTEIRCN